MASYKLVSDVSQYIAAKNRLKDLYDRGGGSQSIDRTAIRKNFVRLNVGLHPNDSDYRHLLSPETRKRLEER